MKNKLMTIWFGIATIYAMAQTTIPTSDFIKIDQFGYLPNATKVAVISNPQTGFNANLSFNAGNTYEVRNWQTGAVLFTGSPQQWNGGATHTQSGDKGWWFDFSTVTATGSYYIYDITNNVRSHRFEIDENVYSPVLRAAMRMFYYNRCNFAKQAPFAEPGFTDGLAFSNNLQDGNSRFVCDKNNPATEKDLSGGWFDAGDFNKYVTFADRAMHDLLLAYEENTNIFTDNFNIPESGNGIPDILDELKWELDWLMKMNNSDGSTHIKIGSSNHQDNSAAPPSTNTDPRYYGYTCTSASISVAGVFAHAARVFKTIPGMSSYAQQLQNRAVNSWNYVLPFVNSNQLDTNCDDTPTDRQNGNPVCCNFNGNTCNDNRIVSGDADWGAGLQQKKALKAAIYLFALTGNNTYHQFIINNINTIAATQIAGGYWDVYDDDNNNVSFNDATLNDAMLMYSTLANANTNVANSIINSFSIAAGSDYFGFSNADLYRAYMADGAYHWGSNFPKAGYGVLNTLLPKHNINPANHASYHLKAAEQLHYFHGVNPLNLVYLSNMNDFGAENSAPEMFHQWFANGSSWDNSSTSLYGPAPGFITGGPNANFSLSSPSPPAGQPPQKSYASFNDLNNSWEITEPAIYYQAIYVRLLANYAGQQVVCPPAGTPCNDDNPLTQNDVEDGACNCSGSIQPPSDCNQIVNGNFNANTANWELWNSNLTANAGLGNIAGITEEGVNPWDAGIFQSNLIFEQGSTYQIRFDAQATANRTITVKAGLSDGSNIIYQNVNITTSMKTYTLNFNMTASTSFACSLEFHFGANASAFVLDNISLKDLDCCLPEGTSCDDGNPFTQNDVEDGACNCSGSIPPPPDCNQIVNGTFETNVTNWTPWACNLEAVSGRCSVSNLTAGANTWDAGIMQGDLIFEQGKAYEIRFDARASANRSISIKAGLSDGANIIYQNVNITTTMQTYTLSFTMSNSTTFAGTFEIHFGTNASSFVLDNILVQEENCCPATLLPPVTGQNCNQIANGTFDANTAGWFSWFSDIAASSGKFKIDNIVPSENAYDAGVTQPDLFIEQGKQYEISFEARAASPRTLSVKTGLAISPYTNYFYQNVQVNTYQQCYTLNFTMTNASTFSGALEFHFANNTSSIELDNIALTEVPCTETVRTCAPTLTVNGFISNLLYQADNNVNSNGTVMPNTEVHFRSNTSIDLKSDFNVPANTNFNAAIQPCD